MNFTREMTRQPFVVRKLTVDRTTRLTPSIIRITLTGEELEGFRTASPNDHVKIFFPDPMTGVIVAPEIAPDGPRLPAGAPPISRDYTPRAFRPGGGAERAELDIDFVLHGRDGADGPASAWAAQAVAGSDLVVAGPRGSRLLPEGVAGVILLADETALPAFSRWVEMLPPDVPVTAILHVADQSATEYLSGFARERIERLTVTLSSEGPAALLEAVTKLGPIDDQTFVFGAGEAGALLPVRKRLRKELGLPKEQVALSGYWKRGFAGLDHHAPLDPSDPN